MHAVHSLPDFSRAAVLVVGDAMLDRYWTGPSTRVSPEAPVPVVQITDEQMRPGGAANVLLNVLSLGAGGHLVAAIGDDDHGRTLNDLLVSRGAHCHWLVDERAKTVTKLRVLSRHQQLLRMDFEEGFAGVDCASVQAEIDAVLGGCGAMIVSDYGKGTLDDIPALIAMARAAGVPVLIDPKGSDFSRYRGASVITPNLSEFEAVVGRCDDEADLVRRGLALIEEIELDALLVTRSENGMTLLRPGLDPLHLPTRAQDVFDVTGAGDTVIGVLAACLAAGDSWENSTALANAAAGLVVAKIGTSTVSPEELRAAADHPALSTGVVDQRTALQQVRAAQAAGERVVMTNGCFDILHAGHVSYLQQARALGDRLIVAVNDDASVRMLDKGPGRPVNPLEQRMIVLAALQSVDWVVPFSEQTPQRLICELLPDCLVKGGDYEIHEIAGGDCVQESGGSVQVLNFVDGVSTTRLITSIRNTSSEDDA